MLKWIQFWINKLFSSKYKIEGKCNKCGTCCRNITLQFRGKFISTEEEFEEIKTLNSKYEHFEMNGYNSKGVMLFKCKSLLENNTCKEYLFRSLVCRKYPIADQNFIKLGGELFDECGFKFTVDKKFHQYLK